MSKAIGKRVRIRADAQRGFSLLELLITVAILATVLSVVVSGVTQLQKSNTNQAVNVDLTQESRQFMDQAVQDLHQAGFPSVKMFDPATSAANPNLYAVGLVSISSTAIQYEGDVDGTGVSEVFLQLSPATGPCPCTLRRGAVSKASYANGATPAYYTEVDGVVNTNIFTAYDFAGNAIPLPCTPSGSAPTVCAGGSTPITNITNIGLLLNVQSSAPNPMNGAYTNVTVSTEARIKHESLLRRISISGVYQINGLQ
jgi:prepilin-type N-terminal cleavage/methylation domain-containing protein